MAVVANDNVQINAGKSSEAKYLNSLNLPYTGTTQVLSQVPISYRHIGLTVNVGNSEYWFKTGVADGDLILKSQDLTGYVPYTGGTRNIVLTGNTITATNLSGVNTGDDWEDILIPYNYGNLYNWYTVDTGKLAPIGWHVPSGDEWTTLTTYLGGETVAGGKLKSTRTSPTIRPSWDSPNIGATNSTGFNMLPGGIQQNTYVNLHNYGYLWLTNSYNITHANSIFFGLYGNGTYNANDYKYNGLSVRCIKTSGIYTPNEIVTDADGNKYATVQIGTQVWLTQNLKTTKYNDGSSIPNVTGNTEWNALTTGAYCTYNNESLSTYEDPTFGYSAGVIQPIDSKHIDASIIDNLPNPDLTGYVTGPTGSTIGNIPVFGNTSGSTLTDSGIGLDNFILQAVSINYTDLVALKASSSLIPLQTYFINDYQTVYTIPNTAEIASGSIEPLLITAVSSTELAVKGRSSVYGNDEIYYDIVSDQAMVPGCTKGYIYRRIDTLKNNDIGFDYRNVKFRRWQIDVTNIWDIGISYTKGSVVLNGITTEIYISLGNDNLGNDVSLTDKWKRFEWDNFTYVSPYEGAWYIIDASYQIAVPCTSPSEYTDYYMFSTNNTMGGTQSSYDYIYNNKFNGNNSYILTLSNSVFFGNNFYSNTIGNYFTYNTIGDNFAYNTIGDQFYSNTIGTSFFSNTIGNQFFSNTIGDNFFYNTIGDQFYSNTIGDNFFYNTVNVYVNSKDFTSVTELYSKNYGHQITSTPLSPSNTNCKIEWTDEFGDTNIIRL